MKISLPRFPQKQQTVIQDFQEVTISLFSPNFRIYTVTGSILKQKKIIPENWQLIQEKLVNPNLIRFVFSNGFKIQTQPNKISFTTMIKKESLPLHEIIRNFVYAFPQFVYNRIQILPRRLISLPGENDVAKNFIKNILLQEGDWQSFRNVKPRAEVFFYYHINNRFLVLKINDVKFKTRKNNIKPAIFFRGLFNENLVNNRKIVNLQKLDNIISNYDEYVNIFNTVIDQVFGD